MPTARNTAAVEKGFAHIGDHLVRDVSLPALVLHREALEHNIHWMQSFVSNSGAQLAPHGKTSMTPALFRRQLDAGAWGITLASATQTRAAYAHGVRRVLMANQLVGSANMALIADLLADPTFDFYCMVDHPDNVADLGAYFASRGVRLNVMIEYGVIAVNHPFVAFDPGQGQGWLGVDGLGQVEDFLLGAAAATTADHAVLDHHVQAHATGRKISAEVGHVVRVIDHAMEVESRVCQ